MKLKLLLVAIVLPALTACAWVDLSTGGEKVRILAENEVASCKHIGKTTANVADKVAGLKRKDKIVEENLEILARNAAHEMGGDTIVAVSEITDGTRTYKVYKCVGQ